MSNLSGESKVALGLLAVGTIGYVAYKTYQNRSRISRSLQEAKAAKAFFENMTDEESLDAREDMQDTADRVKKRRETQRLIEAAEKAADAKLKEQKIEHMANDIVAKAKAANAKATHGKKDKPAVA